MRARVAALALAAGLVMATPATSRTIGSHQEFTASVDDNFTCSEMIDIKIDANTPRAFNDNAAGLSKMIGLVRVAMGFECPQATKINIVGYHNEQQLITSSTSKSTQWRLEPLQLVKSSNTSPAATDSEAVLQMENMQATSPGKIDPNNAQNQMQGLVITGAAADQSQSWPYVMEISQYDGQNGAFEGKIEWTTLNAIHVVKGSIHNDGYMTFKEVSAIKSGGAALGCVYKLNMSESAAQSLSGNYNCNSLTGSATAELPADFSWAVLPAMSSEELQKEVPTDEIQNSSKSVAVNGASPEPENNAVSQQLLNPSFYVETSRSFSITWEMDNFSFKIGLWDDIKYAGFLGSAVRSQARDKLRNLCEDTEHPMVVRLKIGDRIFELRPIVYHHMKGCMIKTTEDTSSVYTEIAKVDYVEVMVFLPGISENQNLWHKIAKRTLAVSVPTSAPPPPKTALELNPVYVKCNADFTVKTYYDCTCLATSAPDYKDRAVMGKNPEANLQAYRAQLARHEYGLKHAQENNLPSQIARSETRIAEFKKLINEIQNPSSVKDVDPEKVYRAMLVEGVCKNHKGVKKNYKAQCQSGPNGSSKDCECIGQKAADEWLATKQPLDSRLMVNLPARASIACR